MRKILILTAAVVAAVIFFVLATLPPKPVPVDLSGADPVLVARTVAGAYHIHTTRSDGAEDKASVAAAAQRAGLKFAIFADHGDGTRPPDPPEYLNGVLCLDGVEISTNGGHYVALDMPGPAPYPLGGEAAAVVEDVARLGGFGIAAHPDSPKRELAWHDWLAPIDGIEWLSVDTEWRDETSGTLARAAVDYLVRPAPAIASILDRPQTTLDHWRVAMAERHVVALGAVDAHGGGRRRVEGGWPGVLGPSYEASFRAVSNRVLLERPFSGDAISDARLLMAAIRKGRVYTVIDAIASPALFDFDAGKPTWVIPPRSRVERIGPDGASSRYEVHVEGSPGRPPVPWVLTNDIAPRAPRANREPYFPPSGGVPVEGEWRLEKDPQTTGRVRVTGEGTAVLDYRLAPSPRADQFAALVIDLTRAIPAKQIAFDAQASGPMRVSVQLRFPDTGGARWTKSVYVDQRRRRAGVALSEMVAAETSGPVPDATRAGSLLFVVDLTNAAPGATGSVTISDVRLPTFGPFDARADAPSGRSPAAPR